MERQNENAQRTDPARKRNERRPRNDSEEKRPSFGELQAEIKALKDQFAEHQKLMEENLGKVNSELERLEGRLGPANDN